MQTSRITRTLGPRSVWSGCSVLVQNHQAQNLAHASCLRYRAVPLLGKLAPAARAPCVRKPEGCILHSQPRPPLQERNTIEFSPLPLPQSASETGVPAGGDKHIVAAVFYFLHNCHRSTLFIPYASIRHFAFCKDTATFGRATRLLARTLLFQAGTCTFRRGKDACTPSARYITARLGGLVCRHARVHTHAHRALTC
ncbi:hypothetical protein BC628DRAFT_66910 [Trametes gibbosa]|nr:hypothetical protein BC628DRAFT_66910 [Trametes gibbosa]